MIVYFVLGMQGVGKSRYIAEHFPTADRVDIEKYWELAKAREDMDFYEMATWTKMMAMSELTYTACQYTPAIVVECTGMTKVNQAAVQAMAQIATGFGYEAKVIWLTYRSFDTWIETLEDNPGAIGMINSRVRGGPQWRDPDGCPYLDVKTVQVDHSSWTWKEKTDRWQDDS